MKGPMLVIAVFLLASIQLQSQVKGYQPKSAEEAEIVRIENEWCDAAIKRDASRLADIFADDIIWTEEERFRNKAGVLHYYMVEVQERAIELGNMRMRIEGDIAVVVSQIHVVKAVAGKTTDSSHTSTDVFRKRAGKWQLIVE
jgi:ketosteroid isomerase-like protein